MSKLIPLFISIPHSGERVPDFCRWLLSLPEEILMCDVDRYVDLLYESTAKKLSIPLMKTEWHRYAADLNRTPDDVDAASVEGHQNRPGLHNRGFHWQMTTLRYQLMKEPMSLKMHQDLVKLVYEPFHQKILSEYAAMRQKGFTKIYHLDCHSMPSVGTSEHRDPGQKRADIVVSDCTQKSSEKRFVDLVQEAYSKAGFQVAYNWPYLGGKVSEQYGRPHFGQHAVQVEMNRALYMDEKTKKILPVHHSVQKQIEVALTHIQATMQSWSDL